ncbi:MAG: sigma-54 dependent transcriptional regulator, acetoin dehydrogenase operon transcriptional [Thermosediminibacterales bacterium]|nr:sigma-54 dependent transcriptional regulator, acetoin dehydrogenase operon transcriptional [Thermosediminibacterales bacterium]MDK2836154.1 sigma-54 dependent transcriptional regulator, acetoin dehydrogenase operon transcriptional [Thermosediminibacterales bacterium]
MALLLKPSEFKDKIKRAWQNYVERGIIDENTVRPIIRRSWKRCKLLNVDPYNGRGTIFLTDEKLKERRERRKEVIEIARPMMENLYKLVEGSGFVVIFGDEDGFLLEVIGDPEVVERGAGLNFVKGVNWSEKYVGTNAIGTTLVEDQPIQVVAAEHYCQYHHTWTCSAAPIHDPDGRLIGMLNMSGHYSKVHSHTLGMVVAAVQSIENQLRVKRESEKVFNLNEYLKATFQSITEGLISLDEKGYISDLNFIAEKMLGVKAKSLLGKHVSETVIKGLDLEEILMTGKGYMDRQMSIDVNGQTMYFTVTARTIIDKNCNVIGVVTSLREMKRITKLVHKVVGAQANFKFNDIIGESRQIKDCIKLGILAAKSSSNLLIEGESGTGKELFAQAVHNASLRNSGPFVAINCAAIPRELLESELFGYESGSFTGAHKEGRPGKFELADGGTILLDEIGDMPLELQAKLLRVLQEKSITRIGGLKAIPVNVRVIAVTNRDLAKEVKNKNFRSDLYYRLNVLYIKIPPLRKRREDIPLLIQHFLNKNRQKLATNKKIRFSREAVDILENYNWPGNVRELENVIERAVNIVEGDLITQEHLPDYLITDFKEKPSVDQINPLEETEKNMILNALKSYKGNISKAARALGIGRTTLYRKIKKYNLAVESN